jgi:hypothetical protein
VTPSAPSFESPLSETALRLGHVGLAPFVLGAALVWIVNAEAHFYVTMALAVWAALVIAFLGGIHWGLAMRQSAPPASLWLWGVSPSLFAWVAVMMPPRSGLFIDGLLLIAGYLVDRKVYPVQGIARWLMLRFRLSSVAALCCFLGAAGA